MASVLIAAAGWHDEAPGGANRLPTDFARFLAARGHTVTYLCSSNTSSSRLASVDGVDLRRYPAPDAPSPSLANLRRHWWQAYRIAREVLAERSLDALLGHAPLQYLAAGVACGRRVRRCYGVHSPFAVELREGAGPCVSVRQRCAWQAASMLERRILAVSDLVHCDSAYTHALMASTYPRAVHGKTLVLAGWVDTTRFSIGAAPRAALRAALGPPWNQQATTFFTLRRLVPRMGLDTLIDAAALLAARDRPFRLVIGGDGPERPHLEQLAASRGLADRVAFVGRVPEDRLVDSFRAADCFVLPTRALECFGLIVLESLACGVPVIGVPVGAIPEVVGSDLEPWIAAENTAAALASGMDDFLSGRIAADPAVLRRRALEFDIQTVARRHERMLLGSAAAAARVEYVPPLADAGASRVKP